MYVRDVAAVLRLVAMQDVLANDRERLFRSSVLRLQEGLQARAFSTRKIKSSGLKALLKEHLALDTRFL
jgi:hypothetical protein